jgi:hypothetical protein
MARIQVITIIVTILFLVYIARQIIKGRLREEFHSVAYLFNHINDLFGLERWLRCYNKPLRDS